VDASARAGWQAIDVARAYLDGGARFLQVRAKTLSSAAFLDLASEVVRLSRASRATVIVNDRADIAKLAAADGVHVGRDDLPPAAARSFLGDAALVGTSTHTGAQID
jgi:thiamine-phosphate pyrophosphorylase